MDGSVVSLLGLGVRDRAGRGGVGSGGQLALLIGQDRSHVFPEAKSAVLSPQKKLPCAADVQLVV